MQRHYSLRLRAPESDGAALTDAILRRIDGLGVYYAVFVNGDEMGLVEDDDRMKAMLRSNLYYQIPNSAIYASYHGEIDIRAVYAPDGMTTPYDDMVLLVRGRAPIRCVDAEGNTYDFAYGLNWSGVIDDERVKTYKVAPLTKPEA